MPVVLPEHLFPWLLKHQEEAIPSDDAVSQYWNHMAMKNIPWVKRVIETGGIYIPIYLWGDDAIFNERNEKIVSVVCGSWLDERKNSKDTVYPLFTYRLEPRMHTTSGVQCSPCFEKMKHKFWLVSSHLPAQELSLGFETLQAFMAPVSWWPWAERSGNRVWNLFLMGQGFANWPWGGGIPEPTFYWGGCPWQNSRCWKPNHSVPDHWFLGWLDMA